MPPADSAPSGLRERKKAKTRAAIQAHALRLFKEQGYASTTVEQIAQAAEVSPSTFFRYFPAKEDVVFYDDYDPLLIAAFAAQPADLAPIRALRESIRSVLAGLSPEQRALERERGQLQFAVPELRARMLFVLQDSVRLLTEQLALRVGRDPGDFAVRNLTGAVVGVMMAATLEAADDPEADMVALMDAALAHLEQGLPI